MDLKQLLATANEDEWEVRMNRRRGSFNEPLLWAALTTLIWVFLLGKGAIWLYHACSW